MLGFVNTLALEHQPQCIFLGMFILGVTNDVFSCLGAGYVCLIKSKKDIQKDDLEEVLNVLAVSELREIRSTMNKVRKFVIK